MTNFADFLIPKMKQSDQTGKPVIGQNVLVGPAYQVWCYTRDGKHIPELQKGLLVLWAEHAERIGYDPSGVVFETPFGNWQLIRTMGGWDWQKA